MEKNLEGAGKLNVKFLCLSKYHAMMTRGEVQREWW
jgi:hypothetical protein